MKSVALCLLLAFPLLADAGVPHWWSFENHPYYDPLIAGVREPHISAMFPGSATRMSFMVNDDSPRMVWDIDVGAELPLFGRESTASPGNVAAGEWGIGLWFPIDFHMIEDFVDDSGPIVNTDYRFGGMIKFRYGLGGDRSVAARVHIGHESTHLGDEFSIVGKRTFPREFERINVSWEYLDVGGMYEFSSGPRLWNVRGGVTTTLPFNDSYYQTGPGTITESALGSVTESSNWFDPYLGVEVLREGFRDKYDLYASTELRWRSVYDYHKADPNAAEERQASVNVIVGVKKVGAGRGGIGRASPFLRFYRGVNPHGQFRNQKDFTEIGFGIRLVR
jgi:Protein of unknown function (DUF1207)